MRKRAVRVIVGILVALCAVIVILLKSGYSETDHYDGVTMIIDNTSDGINQTPQTTKTLDNVKQEAQLADATDRVDQEAQSTEVLNDVSRIFMKDSSNGWAFLQNGTLISTDDEWKTNKKMIQYEGYDTRASISYIDNSFLVIGFLLKNQHLDIYSSTDEGDNWSESFIDDPDIEAGSGQTFTSFIDKQNGYVLYCGDPALGMMAKFLYKTSDGGKTFERVEDVSYINGYPTGIGFNQDGIGFITCSYHGNDDAYLYTSQDQGKSWNTITLQPPEDISYSYINGYPPCFIGENGLMIVEYASEQPVYIMYFTSDGGQTWIPDGSVKIESPSMQGISNYSLCDLNTIYIIENTGKLYKRVKSLDEWN